uniref:Uncharacterized protein n=1 Tax=Avena sativa TaxID=4498 RepID=A0ACD5WVV4_AVESA
MAGVWAALRPYVKHGICGTLIGLTVSDRYISLAAVKGASMQPTLGDRTGEYALVERSCLDFSHGQVVTFLLPADHRTTVVSRLIGLPGDWISVPEAAEIRKIPEGHCWVEGDNGTDSWDSRHLALCLLVWCGGGSRTWLGRLTRLAGSIRGCQKEGSCRSSDTFSLSSLVPL